MAEVPTRPAAELPADASREFVHMGRLEAVRNLETDAGLGREAVEAVVGAGERRQRRPPERIRHVPNVHDALLVLPQRAIQLRE